MRIEHQGVPDIEPRYWESHNFRQSVPHFPYKANASRAQRPGGNVLVPAGICAIILVACLTPFWGSLPALVPRPLSGIAEYAPFILIVLSGLLAEICRDIHLKVKKRTTWFKLSEQGIEYCEFGKSKRLSWYDADRIVWDTEPGKNNQNYLVAELAGAHCKIRISEQFFSERQVKLVYGLAQLHAPEQACD